ncbi:MAG: phage portal protein [Bacillota bacterium]
MKLLNNLQIRLTAMRLGLSIMGEGLGFKAPRGGVLSAIASFLQPRWGEPPKRNSQQWVELYGKSPRLRPVYKIAKDVAAADWGLFVNRGKQKEQILNHPMIDLLSRPNPKMTGYTLMFLTEIYLQLRGEAGWLIERNGLRTPAELWPIPPHWVTELPSANKPFFTVQTPAGQIMTINERDMIWFTEPDPANPYGRGLGPAEGIGDEVETDEYMAKYSKRFFFNDAKPPVVMQAPGADKATAERLKEEWMEKYAGYNNAHKPAILPWEAKIQELGKAQREMDFVESRKFIRDTANQHFFMPPEVIGIIENSNRATIDAADYLYTKNVLKPCLDLIQEQVQIQLCPEFDAKLLFEFANPIPEDKEFKLKVSSEGLQCGAVTVDEWRQDNGKDPLPGGRGKVLYVPISVIPTDNPGEVMGQEPEEPPQEGEAEGKSKIKALTQEAKTTVWWTFEKAATKHEANVQRAMKKYFQAQQDEATRKLEELLGEKAIKESGEDITEKLLNWKKEQKRLLEILTPFWLAGAEDGMTVANETFALGITFDLIRPEMLTWIKTEGAELVKGITETTAQALRETLAEGIEQGESVPKLRDRVSAVFSDAKGRRATTIARTETHGSVVRGTFSTYKAADIEKKEWLATRDSRTRDSHRGIDGEIRNIDEPFSNGLMHPGGSGPAKEVINCRCSLLPVIEDEE